MVAFSTPRSARRARSAPSASIPLGCGAKCPDQRERNRACRTVCAHFGFGPLVGCPQVPDRLSPSGHDWIALGVLAFVLHTALAERELVLRVHQRRRGAPLHAVDAARPERAV